MCCNCCSVRQQKIWVFTVGSFLLATGIVLVTAWPSISRALINSMLPLTPTSYTFGKWEVTPIPIYLNFYLFNWTNSHEVNNPNVKPHFDELGPYAFREVRVKENLAWNSRNNTVTYFGRRTWYFDPVQSNGSLDDLITSPHILSAAASKTSRLFPKVARKIVNFSLKREGGELTITQSAIDWIFKGFYDDYFDFVERLHSPLLPVYSNKFAWFYNRNDSKEAEGNFTIHTGKTDLSHMGVLKLWNGSDHTGNYEGECGRVNGSTGELWSPGKSWLNSISIFITDAGRFINLFPQRNVSYRGVDSWLYTSTDQTFDNGYIAADTNCFCVRNHECPKNGVVDYSPLAPFVPAFLSHPHFYMTDPIYLENVTGLNPDPDKHRIDILMEPTLGIPLKINGQIQLSVLVEQDDSIDIFRHVAHNFYAPLVVVQIKADIDDELLNFVKFVLSVPHIGQYAGIGLIVLGLIAIVVGTWLTKTHNWRGDSVDKNKGAQ